MNREILVSSDPLEDRVALLEDGLLAEIFIARGERIVGSIYKGRVANVLPGMQAAFVDVGLERNTFLSLDDALPSYLHEDIEEDSRRSRPRPAPIEKIMKPRQETLVQLVKEPIGTKGGRITTNIALPGRYLVFMPRGNYSGVSRRVENAGERERLKHIAQKIKPENSGVIIRTAAETKDESVLKRDLDQLVELWDVIQKRAEKARAPQLVHQDIGLTDRILRDLFSENVGKFLVDSRPLFEKVVEYAKAESPDLSSRVYFYEGRKPLFDLYGIDAEIEKLLRKKVWLSSGGSIIIETTEALSVIDVNTGKYVGTTRSLDDTILRTNLEAAAEIARQIRLRDLSGIIIIDFIDMERREDQRKLLLELEDQLKADRAHPVLFGITELGLVEITRKRAGKNLDRTLREECFYCGGGGRVWTPESMGIRIEREIRRDAAESKFSGLSVIAHPQVALHLAGWEGERIADLEKAVGKEVFLRADPDYHMEKYRLVWDDADLLRGSLSFLKEEATMEVEVQGVHPLNVQSGTAFMAGEILEISNAGNRTGEKLSVKIVSAGRSYATASAVSS